MEEATIVEESMIAIDRELLAEIDKVGIPLGLTRSQVVQQALERWLMLRRSGEAFEKQWIAALQKNPDDPKDADAWTDVQVWEDQ